MRDYAKIAPRFWTGETGKLLRTEGPEAVMVAVYLLSAPTSNMIGLYYLPVSTIAHETGLTEEGASKALRRVCQTGFCQYDPSSEVVFIPEMARYQVGESLSKNDKRIKGVIREAENYRKCAFYAEFMAHYRKPYHLPEQKPLASPSEGPPKALRSQEQEQEQDQFFPASAGPNGGSLSLEAFLRAIDQGSNGGYVYSPPTKGQAVTLQAFVGKCDPNLLAAYVGATYSGRGGEPLGTPLLASKVSDLAAKAKRWDASGRPALGPARSFKAQDAERVKAVEDDRPECKEWKL